MPPPDPSRRQFLQTTAASVAAMSALASAQVPNNPNRRRPNIILILLDDLGTLDLNCYGSHDLSTPNFDALAASGIRFTQFYSASPVCSPSRGATLTSRYPHRNGLTNNAGSQPNLGSFLPPDQPTLATILKQNGYATAHVGKWHLGYTNQTLPTARGFDTSFGHMGGCIDNYSHFFYWEGPNRHDLWQNGTEIHRESEYFPNLLIEQCKTTISNHKDHPFFLYLAINQPHYPLQGTAHWRDHYKNLPSPRNMYAASVSTADDILGQVLSHLDSLNLRNDTIIAFQSDHGHSTEERTFGGGGNPGPYRGAKFSLFEAGIRVPAILSYAGVIQPGTREQPVFGIDLLPTILELASLPPVSHQIDGRSLLPILNNPDAPTTHPTYHWQLGNQWAVRDGDWKLIGNPNDTSHKAPITKDDKLFLSNLAQDITEMKNLAEQHPDQVERLCKLHDQWLTSLRA